jgi:ribosomal protein S18 acetylase RimI-like enzyme
MAFPKLAADPPFTLRRMTPEDLPSADALRSAAGWNQTPADLARLLAWEPACCFVATVKDTIVGTATATCYGTELAWIGMVLVAPECQRRGIGRWLVERCLAELDDRGIGCVRLDATPAGQPVYSRLGFVPEWSLARWQQTEANAPRMPERVALCDLRLTDWEELALPDRKAFGADRARCLRGLAEDCHAARVVIDDQQIPRAYGMLRPGSLADYLGPVVAASPTEGRALVFDLVSRSRHDKLFWDIPDRNTAAIAVAAELGFRRQRPLVRMWRGAPRPVADARLQWALADPALG